MADNKGVIRTPAGSMPTSAADKEAVCGASWKTGIVLKIIFMQPRFKRKG